MSTLAGSDASGFANGTGAAASFAGPGGVTVDSDGNVFVADTGNHAVRKITATGLVSTFAGTGSAGFTNGSGTAASFDFPAGIAVDGNGNVFVADTENHAIRKITPEGMASTLAGAGGDRFGLINGTGTTAIFTSTSGVAVDSSGNVFVADTDNHVIRSISPAGVVSTLAGSGTAGSTNGTGTAARFDYPSGVAVDSSGNVFVSELGNTIRKITPAGLVSTLAGNRSSGFTNGTGAAARFDFPGGVAVDSSGNVFVADMYNHAIRKITPVGVVSTLAGSGTEGFANGIGTAASFSYPYGVAVDSSGNVFVADQGNNAVRKITPAGVVSTLAGGDSWGWNDGTGTAASFTAPVGVAVDGNGNVFVADSGNHAIRRITPPGVVSTLAGGRPQGFVDGIGAAARFDQPQGVTVDSLGNVYVADTVNNAIRKITPAGVVTTLAGGNEGYVNGTSTAASFNVPIGVSVDSNGNVFVADGWNQAIRIILP